MRTAIVLAIVGTLFSACTPAGPDKPAGVPRPLTPSNAVALARQACVGVSEISDKTPAIVREDRGLYVVTFRTPGGMHGGYTRVTIERKTGRLVRGVEIVE